MDSSLSSLTAEQRVWLTQLAQSREQILAKAGGLDATALHHLADSEAKQILTLQPMPEDVALHLRAAHAFARPNLERLTQYDPTIEVTATDNEHRYTPRKVLRRVLDHTLDHLNQLEQWLTWQREAIVPVPTDGWATSAMTLEEDRLSLSAADLASWLWRIDLVVELLAQQAEQLRAEELDWTPPDGGWTLRYMLHHLASAEVYYVFWLDAAFPEEASARYAEASRRLREQLERALSLPAGEQVIFFDGETTTTLEQVVGEILAAERSLLHG